MARAPYPLQWPEGWARTRYRDRSQFDKSRGFNAARDGAIHQLELFRASHIVITSNLPVNSKGLPHHTSSGQISDPGIAVWWIKGGKEHALACDRWLSAVENMRAIEKTLEALRGIDRWGSQQMVEQAFAGFAALPPGSGESVGEVEVHKHVETWRDIFGVNIAPWKDLPDEDLFAIVKARYREQIKAVHPDITGTTVHEATRLNAALQAAEKELKRGA